MKTFKEILEAKQVGKLYHHTSFINLLKILKTNFIAVGPTGFVSFTRSKSFLNTATVGLSGVGGELIIDGDKLSNNYKIQPYKYHNLDYIVGDEFEERTEKSVKDAKKYIIGINLYKTFFPDDHKSLILLNRIMDMSIDYDNSIYQVKKFINDNYKIRVDIK